MSSTVEVLLSTVTPICAALGGLGGFFAWREMRSDHSDKRTADQTRQQIDTAMHGTDHRITVLEQYVEHAPEAIEAAVARAFGPLNATVSGLSSKMDTVLMLLPQLAREHAKELHHPIPERAEVDHLLDAFLDETITAAEEARLRELLVKIRDYRPGQDIGFPVFPGEPYHAGALLVLMDVAITQMGGGTAGAGES